MPLKKNVFCFFIIVVLIFSFFNIALAVDYSDIIQDLRSRSGPLNYTVFKELEDTANGAYKLYVIDINNDTQNYPSMTIDLPDNLQGLRSAIAGSGESREYIERLFGETLLSYRTYFESDDAGNQYLILIEEQESEIAPVENTQTGLIIVGIVVLIIIMVIVFKPKTKTAIQTNDDSKITPTTEFAPLDINQINDLIHECSELLKKHPSGKEVGCVPKSRWNELSSMVVKSRNIIKNEVHQDKIDTACQKLETTRESFMESIIEKSQEEPAPQTIDSPRNDSVNHNKRESAVIVIGMVPYFVTELYEKRIDILEYLKTFARRLDKEIFNLEEKCKINSSHVNEAEERGNSGNETGIHRDIMEFQNNLYRIKKDENAFNQHLKELEECFQSEDNHKVMYKAQNIILDIKTDIKEIEREINSLYIKNDEIYSKVAKILGDRPESNKGLEYVIKYMFQSLNNNLTALYEQNVELSKIMKHHDIENSREAKKIMTGLEQMTKTITEVLHSSTSQIEGKFEKNIQTITEKLKSSDGKNLSKEDVNDVHATIDSLKDDLYEVYEKLEELNAKADQSITDSRINDLTQSIQAVSLRYQSKVDFLEDVNAKLHNSYQTLLDKGAKYNDIEVHFSDFKRVVSEELSTAQHSLWIKMYDWTETDTLRIITRLNSSQNKNIDLRILMDAEKYSQNKQSRDLKNLFELFSKIENSIRIIDNKAVSKYGKMHEKTAIIDKRTVLTGSLNYTNTALKDRSFENLLLVRDINVINEFREEFEKNWNLGRDVL